MKKELAILFFIVAFLFQVKAQEANSEEVNMKGVNKLTKGITIGYDASGLAIKLFQNYRTSADFSITAGSFNRYNYTIESGFLKIDNKTTLFNYKSNGQYVKVGLDYNFYKNRGKADENTLVFVGARYGFASLVHSASNITIIDAKWGNYTAADLPETEVKAQWLELTGGLRVEILRNFSMGWSGRLRFLIDSKGEKNIKPFIIPGYGRGTNNTVIDFTYSLYYTIPFNRNR